MKAQPCRTALLLSLVLIGCGGAPELPRFAEPTSALRPVPQRGRVPEAARVTDYELEALLDEERHRITGSARVTWRNRTQRTVDTLPFHLYMNGFRAEDTAWMQTSRGNHRRSSQEEDGAWGFIDIDAVRLEAAPWLVLDAEAPLAAIDLPWHEDPEPSTMTVDLPQPVGPEETLTVQLDFTVQLPSVIARTGYADDFHAVAQWYPKLGVLEDEAGWQAHTFSVNDEFYADFGNYTVTLDVAEDQVVGATGTRIGEETVDSRKRLKYRAEMVHDFVWMADPNFVEHHGEWQGVRIRQLIQPDRVADAEDHLQVVLDAFESYHSRFGPYPWSTLTIVHPPEGAEGAGGMEYPTFFTTTDRAPLPAWARAVVVDERMSGLFTTLHEFGHQYFQGLFASREHLEPWLDEGVNTTSNLLAIMDREQDANPWMLRLLSQKVYLSDMTRFAIAERGFLQPLADPAKAFRSTNRNYGATVYTRAAATLLTLRNIVGHAAFDAAFRAYAETARFRHPRGSELETALVRGLGERPNVAAASAEPVPFDVQHFLDQALRTTRQVDFEIRGIRLRALRGQAGWQRGPEGELAGGQPPSYLGKQLDELENEAVEGLVTVRRSGGFEVPVDIRFDFQDDTSEILTWSSREPVQIFHWPGRRVRRVIIDPDNKLLLEWNRLDNVGYAPELDEPDGLSRPLGDITEALSLALMGLGL